MGGLFVYIRRGLMAVFALSSVRVCMIAQEVLVDADTVMAECSLPEGADGRWESLLGHCGAAPVCPLNPCVAVHSTMVGVGMANVLDTYLSPYNYTGPELRVVRETERMTRLWHGRISNQSLIELNASHLENRTGTAKEWAGGIRYSMGWHYNFMPVSGFCFRTGMLASGYAGAVYNTRNGNNPAQAKVDVTIDLSASVIYVLRMAAHSSVVLRYQLNMPFVGVAFSPNYGQSYYEIFSLGNYDHNAVLVYPGNMPSMRHLLTADIPLGNSAALLRVGYSGQFDQASFNELRYHSYSHSFMIGFVKCFRRL